MWPFSKPRTLREIEHERFPELVDAIAKKWPAYLLECERQGYGRPPLVMQLATFGVRAAGALRSTNFAVRRSEDTYFMLAIAVGIVKSGEYTRAEVEEAAGFPIPEHLVR